MEKIGEEKEARKGVRRGRESRKKAKVKESKAERHKKMSTIIFN